MTGATGGSTMKPPGRTRRDAAKKAQERLRYYNNSPFTQRPYPVDNRTRKERKKKTRRVDPGGTGALAKVDGFSVNYVTHERHRDLAVLLVLVC